LPLTRVSSSIIHRIIDFAAQNFTLIRWRALFFCDFLNTKKEGEGAFEDLFVHLHSIGWYELLYPAKLISKIKDTMMLLAANARIFVNHPPDN